MASGKTHDIGCLLTAGAFLGWGLHDARFNLLGAIAGPYPWLVAGALLGLILSPDLDLPNCSPRRRWGVFGFIWIPYEKFIPHRDRLSHLPLVGTTGRYVYLFGITWGFLSVIAYFTSLILPELQWDGTFHHYAALLMGGTCIADVVHWVLDGCPWGAVDMDWIKKRVDRLIK